VPTGEVGEDPAERQGCFEHHHVTGMGYLGVAGRCGQCPFGHVPPWTGAASGDEVDRGVLEDLAYQWFIAVPAAPCSYQPRGVSVGRGRGGSALRVHILGPVEVVGDGGAVPLPPRVLDLVAVLACRPNTVVPAAQLVDALWPSGPPPTSAKSLQVRVHELRQVLGDPKRVGYQQQGYVLALDAGQLDAVVIAPRQLPMDIREFTGRRQELAQLAAAAGAAADRRLPCWRSRPAVTSARARTPARACSVRLPTL
jgi:hypothetical protein